MFILYWIYCLAFAFDFRGDEGGSSVQYVFVLLSFVSGTLIVWGGRRYLFSLPCGWLSLSWLLFLAFTPIVAFGSGVPFGQYVRCILPLFLCGLSLLVMQAMSACRVTPKGLILPLLISGSISVIWRAIYSLVIKGIPIDSIRYELLSAAAPFFIGYCVVTLVFSVKGVPWNGIFIGGLVFGALFISVTRSYIFTAAVAVLCCVGLAYQSFRWNQWTQQDLAQKLRQSMIVAALGVAFLGAIAVTAPQIMERWTGRLFHNSGTGKETSVDVTLLTRMAEADTQMKILSDQPHHFIHGMGFGATYYWDESYLQELLLIYPERSEITGDHFFPGHSMWMYALFAGGGISLVFHLAFFGGALLISYQVIRRFSVVGAKPDIYLYLPFITLVCYMTQTFTANPFIDRFAGLIIGLFACMPQIYYNALYRQTAPQTSFQPFRHETNQSFSHI